MIKENNFKRMCSFYVSDIHLVTMILPYLSEKLGKGEIITTFLQSDLKNEVELLISKININDNLKERLKNIGWNRINKIKYLDIKDILDKKDRKINVLVVGNNEYIEYINKNLEKYISESGKIINEIDAFRLEDGKKLSKDIIKKYKYLLNTTGECLIEEAFKKKEII